jgi:Fe2+ transport system protein FeoA
MPKQASIPLTDLREQGTFTVDSISDQDTPLLKRLKSHGITPGARLKVSNGSANDFVLRTSAASKNLHLSRELAAAVRVRSAHLAKAGRE